MSNKVTFTMTLTNVKRGIAQWMQKRLESMADNLVRYGVRASLQTTVEVDGGEDKDS